MPVRIPGLGLVHADVAVVLVPTERPVVRDVAPDQAAPVTHPNRALAPERAVVAHAVPDALQRRVALDSGEALVTDLPRWLRVGDRGLAGPVAVAGELIRRRCEWRARGRGRRRRRHGEKVASTHRHVLSPLVSSDTDTRDQSSNRRRAHPIRGGAPTQTPTCTARPLYCKRASAGTLSFPAPPSTRWRSATLRQDVRA